MGLQGNKATHDFLSLYTKDSSFQLQESKPHTPQAGFFLKTHDFLQPLERAVDHQKEKSDKKQTRLPANNTGPTASDRHQQQHVLPGRIGTFTISHSVDNGARATVKPERGTCPVGIGSRPETGSSPCYGAAPFTLWGHTTVTDSGSRGNNISHSSHWSLPFATTSTTTTHGTGTAPAPAPSSRRQQQQQGEKKPGGFMDSGSRSRGEFDDDDLDADDFATRREVSSNFKELSVRLDGKGGSCSGSGTEQRPNTPKSKHSATEQRRRSKINDRFQILKELLPHNDQKRDKASFLLEVIEYIRYLQEKEQKYEVSYPEWNQDNTKLMPWSNTYFRSFWKNAQSKGQTQGDDPSQVMKNGSTPPEYVFQGKFDDSHVGVASAAISRDPTETDPIANMSYRSVGTPINIANNVASQGQAQWPRISGADNGAISSEMLNDQGLTIDEGTISVSSQYSQELLTTLSQALENSGIDLSQASISVQISLGKRAVKRSAAGGTAAQELNNPASTNQATDQLRLGNNVEELSRAAKRHKVDNS